MPKSLTLQIVYNTLFIRFLIATKKINFELVKYY